MAVAQCQAEIERMHAFFVDWFTGKVPASIETLDEHCCRYLSDDFCRITPLGILVSKPQLVVGLMNSYNNSLQTNSTSTSASTSMHTTGSTGEEFEIHIHNVQILLNLSPTLKLVHYEEWQRLNHDTTTARRTTVLLQFQDTQCPTTPATTGSTTTGTSSTQTPPIQWKSVHETWMQDKEPPRDDHDHDSHHDSHMLVATASNNNKMESTTATTTTPSSTSSPPTAVTMETIMTNINNNNIISPRRHVASVDRLSSVGAVLIIPKMDSTTTTTSLMENDIQEGKNTMILGLQYRGLAIQTLQGPMAREQWLESTTQQLQGLAQYHPSDTNQNVDNNDKQQEDIQEPPFGHIIGNDSMTDTVVPTHSASNDNHCRRINLPEICFSQATVTVDLGYWEFPYHNDESEEGDDDDDDDDINNNDALMHTIPRKTLLLWNCEKALEAWSCAHSGIPMGSTMECNGVSIHSTIDAALWSQKEIRNTNFHYDWTFSTPFSVAVENISNNCGTASVPTWMELPTSGLNMELLQDTNQPILYFDDIELFEDDLHDNGVVNFRVKLRLMSTCLYVLSRCWCRVDGVLLQCRETRTMVEFVSQTATEEGSLSSSLSNHTSRQRKTHHRIYRDITWRHCPWSDLIHYNLPADVRAWKNEGATETAAWVGLLNRLPKVPLPPGVPEHSVLVMKTK